MKRVPKVARPQFGGDRKKYTLEVFDHLQSEEQEAKALDLLQKQRDAAEQAKKRF